MVVRSNYDIVNGFFFQKSKILARDGNPIDVRLLEGSSLNSPNVTETSKIFEPLPSSAPYTQTFAQPTRNGLNVEIDLYLAIKEIGNGHPLRVPSAAACRLDFVQCSQYRGTWRLCKSSRSI